MNRDFFTIIEFSKVVLVNMITITSKISLSRSLWHHNKCLWRHQQHYIT